MIVSQVMVEITLPPQFKGMEGIRATMTYKPEEPGSIRVFLPVNELNIDQLAILRTFCDQLCRFGDQAREIVLSLLEK